MGQADVDELLDEYAGLFPDKRPENEAEEAASKELSAKRKEWLTEQAAKRGYEMPGTLQRELDKALKKKLKKSEPKKPKAEAAARPPAPTGEDAPTEGAAPEHAHADDSSEAKDLDEQMRRTLGQPQDNTGDEPKNGKISYFVNRPEVLAKHLQATGGKWQLRFPPEPNGWLHIGHAKAMSVNFGIAKANGGNCYMRFDDTNPEAEKQEYIDGILDNLAWLGHQPFKITYTSDYFEELFELARELIRRGKAYVCQLTGAQVKAQRNALKDFHNARVKDGKLDESVPFPTADVFDANREQLSPQENLRLFDMMRDGRFAEGEATLRMKGDFMSSNPNMWDHMAYRIMFKSHPRTSDKWCIYPTYDYSHCLVDSIENITHSLCTLEFQTRQASDSSYHWLLDALGMYHPKTWESSRCSISYNVMSKRRLQRLVLDGFVRGWDDPRLLTLAGLRRRGYTPTAINTFCRRIGIARSSNEVCVPMGVLESCVRAELDHDAERRMAIIDPLKVVITNFAEAGAPCAVTVPNHPAKGREELGSREVPFTETVYIPREKFRLDMVKGYKGMCPGTPKNAAVRLINAAVVEYEGHDVDAATGQVSEVRVRLLSSGQEVAKGLSVVSWVPSTALRAKVRIYDRLFKDCEVDGVEYHAERAAKEKGVEFTDLFNSDSLREEDILVEPALAEEHLVDKRWQFITVGYFCIDRVDSKPEAPIFNLIVSLREDKTKAQPPPS